MFGNLSGSLAAPQPAVESDGLSIWYNPLKQIPRCTDVVGIFLNKTRSP